MKINFWSVGKAHEAYVKEGIEIFTKRISYYYTVEWKLIAPPKNASSLSNIDLKRSEADIILNLLDSRDILVVLDEKGKQFTSEQLAELIQLTANNSAKNLVFLIGGAFGVDERIIKRANYAWGLSNLVFPHQLVRLILAEQIYRACTIIKNEKYHHS
ncbi:MAG: rRNA ((1915)-N(3))-methyltransferase RlmH [Chitinophagaceae bacterium]|nr:rRNA ((1915)-N(3))-methyltransferase RlmH [Chitinophagaceae bacterium]